MILTCNQDGFLGGVRILASRHRRLIPMLASLLLANAHPLFGQSRVRSVPNRVDVVIALVDSSLHESSGATVIRGLLTTGSRDAILVEESRLSPALLEQAIQTLLVARRLGQDTGYVSAKLRVPIPNESTNGGRGLWNGRERGRSTAIVAHLRQAPLERVDGLGLAKSVVVFLPPARYSNRLFSKK